MKRKILLDSLYINNSGGLRLLEYIVDQLLKKNIPFYLLADRRCQGVFDTVPEVEYMAASMRKRSKWYNTHDLTEYSSVFCFANIPTPIKLHIPVFTYFHNIYLLTLEEAHSIPVKIKSWLKREVFKHYRKNTDYWFVQTTNTANELVKNLGESPDRVKLMPFYEIPKGVSEIANKPHGDDYVFVAVYVEGKAHEELLEAWRILHSKGIDKTLHLTVQNDSPFVEKIMEAQKEDVKVENHGIIPFEKVFDLYKRSKAIVYPSHNESLGLGIVEALTAGCDIIGSDLPFLHSICKPSAVFNPYSPSSIADAIEQYEGGEVTKSELLIHNQIEELIELICKQ